MEATCETLLSSLSRLAGNEISAGQFGALDKLRREIPPRTGAVDPLDAADAEDALSTWLDRRGIASGWTIAAPLAAAGVDVDWCERAAAILEGAALGPALEWVASTFSARAHLGELRESTRRVSELVGAIRSYSQMDRASMQRLDVTEGLESTVLMLGHKLRDGITVTRRYDSGVPIIEAFVGELNQVWTNLIDNAVDAMGGAGELSLVTSTDGTDPDNRRVVIEIADTGEGMSAEVASRAFEPFYTTKDVGKGTGLGLDIARRIVEERHGGSISFDSRPGSSLCGYGSRLRPRQPLVD